MIGWISGVFWGIGVYALYLDFTNASPDQNTVALRFFTTSVLLTCLSLLLARRGD